ncbi:thiamine-phosphate kinase [Microlunatus sp. Gsoil 973]|jgi:thiamine-monophosphate kinase|uniref:thiamine-phosphate kinase n=1 Tax=Microlunatus sp. Gsoil 973 TaxID=2672569 RepID=UPI0012B448C8|nr:thiamine-phosphate kinase [Microlunatus sp. Gsoil 973]QGN33084.1 thiamine-phosphate kinase [Microlunatus sp. Gsoil 973]
MFPTAGGQGGPTLAEVGEFGLIDMIIADLPDRSDVLIGPGDDGAVISVDGPVVCSVDVLVEDVHFKTQWSPAESVGRKAVAVNVADIEAMGATATGLVIGFAAPPETQQSWVLDFARGLRAECQTAGVALLGGDISRAAKIAISVTVLGGLGGLAPVTRSGARPGDVVALRGRLGWAAAGLAVLGRGFRSPRLAVQAYQVPDVPYGTGRVAAAAGATSMIDISDGLLADLGHLAERSRVAIDVARNAFEVPDTLQAVAAATGSDPLNLILTGGEDHALAATFAASDVPEDWVVIGSVSGAVDEPSVTVDGQAWDDDAGWDHYR